MRCVYEKSKKSEKSKYSFEKAASDVVVGERVPQEPNLIGVSPDALPDDRLDGERVDLVGMFTEQIAQLLPQLKLGFA